VRRLAVAGLLALSVLVGVSAAAAQTVSEVVSVEPGPTRLNFLVPPCNDIAIGVDEQTSFVLRRTGPATGPLTVTYRLTGTAQPGVHFQPLSGSVTFPPGVSVVTVDVVPLPTPDGAIVDLTLEVTGGAVANPASATIRFVSPPHSGPRECGYFFSDDPWNRSQTVSVGQPLHALTVEQFRPPSVIPAPGRFRVVSGTLPPGVSLNEDGSFSGTPLVPGTYVARIEACRPAPPGTCVTTDLTVTVHGGQGGFADVITALFASFTAQASAFVQQLDALLQQILAGFPTL
jgi:hypothetical protein